MFIEKILQDVSLNYIRLSNVVTNINWLCREVQNRLQTQYIQEWNSVVHNSPKCINCRTFKTEFKIEFYISELQPKFYIPIVKISNNKSQITNRKGKLGKY